MPTQIQKIISENGGSTIFRIAGEMFAEDARLLEKFSLEAVASEGHDVTIDLADLTFMDSDAAGILRRLQEKTKLRIEGIEIFLQSAIDAAERSGGQ